MRTAALLGLILICGDVAAATVARPTMPAEENVRTLDTVVVSGVRPGPGLWKVSKGSNALWILATVSPVPKKMEWYSPQSEALLRQTQEVIGEPKVGAHVGFSSAFKVAFAMPAIYRARKNADGKLLRDVLPAELYARWLPLKARYLREDIKAVEEWRPQFAAAKLYEAALVSVGLEQGNYVSKRIYALADKHKIKKTSATISFKVTDPKRLAKSFSKSNVDDAACFASVLDRLESDVVDAAQRANAWAIGNVPELTRLARRRRNDSCLEAFMKVEAVREMGMVDALPRARQKWLLAVEAALDTNHTTFSMLPMSELLESDGLLSTLQAKGYRVEAPQ